LFLPCLINTSRAIKLIEVAFYHIPRCTLAERIPIYDSICNANRGQSFQLKLFLFHSPLPLFEHITRRIHTIPVLRLCVCARRSLRRAFFSSYIILFVRVAAAVDGDCPSHLQQLSWPPFNRAYISCARHPSTRSLAHAHCSPSPVESEWKIQKQQFHPGERGLMLLYWVSLFFSLRLARRIRVE
jgi:hypothetical protein